MTFRRHLVAGFHLLILALGTIACPATVSAQSPEYQDRLARIRDVFRNSELALVWSEDDGTGTNFSRQRIYDLNLGEDNVSQRLAPGPIQIDSIVANPRRMAVTTGDYTGSNFENFVAAWSGLDQTITVIVPAIDPETFGWTSTSRLTVDGPTSTAQGAKIRLASGDFTGEDTRDEFVLGFRGDDDTIHLQFFGFPESGLEPEMLGSINDEPVVTDFEAWDLAAGDFDGDGDEDLALLFMKPDGLGSWSIAAKIYSLDGEGSVVPGPTAEVFPEPNFTYSQVDIAAAAGDFDADPSIEISVAFTFAQDDPAPDTYLYVLDVDPDLSVVSTADTMRVTLDAQNESEISPVNVAAGDLDGDYRDEIVLSTGGSMRVFKTNDQLLPVQWKTGGGEEPFSFEDSDSFLQVDDMDGDGKAEVIFAGSFVDLEPNGTQHLSLRVFGIDENLNFVVVGSRSSEFPVDNNLDYRHYAIALGDFDADRVHLGRPVHYRRTGVLQPSVVVNAPPVHYDVLDGTPYDLSGCFPDQQCGFSSSYTQSSSNERTVTIETHADWGVSATNTTDAEVLKVTATAKYGEKFSYSATQKQSITISTGRVAAGDDWIFAQILDIDYYEYPVLDGDNPTPIGYYLVSIPEAGEPLWIEGKNDELLGNNFRPDHEVGNLLSYRKEPSIDLASPIVTFGDQTIGSTGSSSVELKLSNFTETGSSTSWDAGLEVGVKVGLSVDIYGIEIGEDIETKGNFDYGEISTQTVSVQESLEMRGDFGHLQTQFGTSGTYQVQPYAYWTIYGALAIDYMVSLPTGPGSFWQQWYGGKTDVGFSLPWRYDIEKGLPLPGGDASYLMRSRDIVLSTPDPAGGDTVRVGARVRNMGLADITIPVSVDFYLGHPDDGVLIASTTTDSTISAQGSETVIVDWVVPESQMLQNEKIYVVLDAAGQLTNEVHTNNNVGWAPVVAAGIPTSRESAAEIEGHAFTLEPAYPNPFYDHTTIDHGAHGGVARRPVRL